MFTGLAEQRASGPPARPVIRVGLAVWRASRPPGGRPESSRGPASPPARRRFAAEYTRSVLSRPSKSIECLRLGTADLNGEYRAALPQEPGRREARGTHDRFRHSQWPPPTPTQPTPPTPPDVADSETEAEGAAAARLSRTARPSSGPSSLALPLGHPWRLEPASPPHPPPPPSLRNDFGETSASSSRVRRCPGRIA